MDELKSLPVDLQAGYLAVGNLHNDLQILFKLAIRSSVRTEEADLIRVSRNVMAVFFLKLTAGRVAEGYETLSKHVHQLERDHGLVSKMSEESQAHWKELKRYFSQPNPIREVRRKLAFHADTENLVASMEKKLPENIQLQDYHFEQVGNTVFGASELAQLANIALIMGTEDVIEGINRLNDELTQQSQSMMSFCIEFILAALTLFFPEKFGSIEYKSLDFEPESIRTPLAFFYRLA